MTSRISKEELDRLFGKKTAPAKTGDRIESVTGKFSLEPALRQGRFAVSSREDRTIDGNTFDSKKEASRYTQLKLLERAKMISGLELQPCWNVLINGQPFCKYSCDFVYFDNERKRLIYEEIKSSGTAKDPAYRLRRKAAELSFGIRITEVIL